MYVFKKKSLRVNGPLINTHSLFQAPVRIGVIFKQLRKLIDSLLEKKLENPRMNLEGKAKHPNTNFTVMSLA